MRALLPLLVVLAGCGADTEGPDFPKVTTNAAGVAVAKVDGQKQADELCDAAQADWPDAYAKFPYVTFDVPGSGSDFSCVRP